MAGIRATRSGRVGTLTIDNPSRRNAMTADMYSAVPSAAAELTDDGEVRVVVLRGAGDTAFGAGSDISEFRSRRLGDEAAVYDLAEHRAWEALAAIPVPVVAAIHGPCIGGGLAMALHCDVRIAADDATFSVPPARLGLAYPEGALARLVELVGPATAKLLLYSARVADAPEAQRIGLVQEVVPKAELDDHVAQLVSTIIDLAPLTQRATKLSVDAFDRQVSGHERGAGPPGLLRKRRLCRRCASLPRQAAAELRGALSRPLIPGEPQSVRPPYHDHGLRTHGSLRARARLRRRRLGLGHRAPPRPHVRGDRSPGPRRLAVERRSGGLRKSDTSRRSRQGSR